MVAASACASPFNPGNPAASGYALTFNGTFGGPNGIDINNTRAPGFNWYYPSPGAIPAGDVSVDSNGILTLNASASDYSQAILQSAVATSSTTYVGNVWGGGWYVEGSIAFNPAQVNFANGWPCFWAVSIENFIGKAQWSGQVSGYTHFIEDDMFEYMMQAGVNSFSSGMHDWWGIWNTTCSGGYCGVNNNNGIIQLGATNWTQFHTVGQLWVPGSAANNNNGYVTTYFDGTPVMTINWVDQGDGVLPPQGTFTFSIIDKQHLFLVLGTSVGAPMKVQWVHVWQR
jgi:hypothetical protein